MRPENRTTTKPPKPRNHGHTASATPKTGNHGHAKPWKLEQRQKREAMDRPQTFPAECWKYGKNEKLEKGEKLRPSASIFPISHVLTFSFSNFSRSQFLRFSITQLLNFSNLSISQFLNFSNFSNFSVSQFLKFLKFLSFSAVFQLFFSCFSAVFQLCRGFFA